MGSGRRRKEMSQDIISRHVEKLLDKAYVCSTCRAVFLFKSDAEDHSQAEDQQQQQREQGHKQMYIIPLEDTLTA
jgi:hypothetical protein